MNETEKRAIVTLSLLAAFADGDKHDRERAEIKRIAEGLAGSEGVNLPGLYQDVLMNRVSLAAAAEALASPESRQLAYEMAVCVCDADGVKSEAEQHFLEDLRQELGLAPVVASQFSRAAEEIAGASITSAAPVGPDDAALDKTILNASIVNGALELLPETLASMAIIPLQMKLVYGIGKAHGYELDGGHIKDFLAAAGVGLTSQYLERAGRKLLGGLFGGLGRQAASSGMSFASTYALGHVAKKYYAGGRTLSTEMLREAYESVVSEGRRLQGEHLPAMREKARGLGPAQLLEMVRR